MSRSILTRAQIIEIISRGETVFYKGRPITSLDDPDLPVNDAQILYDYPDWDLNPAAYASANAVGIDGYPIEGSPSNGETLVFNNTDRVWQYAAGGGGGIGNVTLTGDVTGSGTTSISTTLANSSVTNAKMSDMPQSTIKGRAAGGGTGVPINLTASEATDILNAFTGDTGTGGVKGLVPAPASGDSGKFLKGDGTWGSVATGLQVNTTSVTSGTDKHILYNNNGTLGAYPVTGSDNVVLSTSPTLTTPNIGTATGTSFNSITGLSSTTPGANSGTGSIGTGTTVARADHVHPTTGLGLTSGTLAQFAATTSAQLAGVISDETGSGALVFATSPTLIKPSIDKLSNLTTNGFVKTSGGDGTLSVDTNTYLTGNQTITLSGDVTGSGTTSITTAIGSGKVTNTMLQNSAITIAGTSTSLGGSISQDTITGLTTTGVVQRTAANTLSTISTTGSGNVVLAASPTLTTPNIGAATGTSLTTTGGGILARQAATQDGVEIRGRAGGTSNWEVILTPATLTADRTLTLPNVSGTVVTTGDVGSVTTTMFAATTGSGNVVLSTSPTLTTPSLGTPTAITLTNATGLPLSGLPSQTASTLLGRGSSSTGNPEVISLGTGLTMSGTTLSASSAATPGGSTTQVQFNDAGSFGGDAGLTYDKATDALTVVGPTTIGELRLRETGGGSDYVGFKAPASVTTNKIWTLPSVDGSSGQVLGTSGAAVLQWQSAREILTANRTYWVGFLPGTGPTPGAVTFSNGSATITCTGHGLQANDPVVFSTTDTLPTNFTAGTTYYVRSTPAMDTFQVSATAGTGSTNTNTAITAGSAGTGTHFVRTGNDNNIGYGTNGRDVALLTVQKAIDLIGSIDTSIYKTTIKCARGQYADAFWVQSLKTINRLDIIGDDRYLAGLTYFHGADIGHNAPAVMNTKAGNGNATISWSTGGTEITITGATTDPNISGDGWGANDKIVLFVPGATGAGTFYEYTVSSTPGAVTATKITITGATLPTAPSPMTAGVCVTFIPNVRLQSSSNGGRTVGGEINVTNTTSVLIKGWHLRVGSNFTDVLLSKDNSSVSCGWNLIDYRGTTQNYVNGFSASSAKLNSSALDALGHMPNSIMGGLAYNSYAVIAQTNSEIILRSVKFINIASGINAFDRSYIDAVFNQMVSVDTGFEVQRYSYVYGIAGQVLNSTRIQSAASPTPSSTNNSQIQR